MATVKAVKRPKGCMTEQSVHATNYYVSVTELTRLKIVYYLKGHLCVSLAGRCCVT